MSDLQIEQSWHAYIGDEFSKPYMNSLRSFLIEEQKKQTTFPPNKLIFNAFNLCPFQNVKVVILGQDPYHGPGQAHGLCFSVPRGTAIPPSLRNIYQALKNDLDCAIPKHGELIAWAQQGVFLLNTTLSVREHSPLSHQNKGWETFTDTVIEILSKEHPHLVFMLWGKHAQSKESLIDINKHLILKAVHPSPLSAHRGFFDCRHFSKANDFLQKHNMTPIFWQIQD